MAKIDERIAALENRLKVERAKKQRIEARKRSVEKRRTRAQDTRRKILVGAVVLSLHEKGEWPPATDLTTLLDRELRHRRDRELFDLPPLPIDEIVGKMPIAGQKRPSEAS